MPSRLLRPLAVVPLLLLTAAGCGSLSRPAPTAPAGATPPLASYVLLAEAPGGAAVAFARAIVASGAGCPDLVGADSRLAMTKRLNPHGFEVDVCEAVVPFGGVFTLGDGGPALPMATEGVARVAVFGDTGCKPQDQDGCGLDDPAWPFPQLAAAAAARQPDLVLHVGDYNYRGTPSSFERTVDGQQVKTYYYDAGDGAPPSELCGIPGPYYSQNSTGNPDADTWQAWWLDFFQPAAPLLAAAPWVFARGNHELCSHAGPGWFYFLDASSELPEGGSTQLACPSQDGEGPAEPHLAFVPPRAVRLTGVTAAVIDSANACDELPGFTTTYASQLSDLASRLGAGSNWLIGHRPVWGVQGTADGPPYGCDGQPTTGPTSTYTAFNVTLQCALADPAAAALLPKLSLLLTGHMHRFESLSFPAGSARPPSFIAGNGGVVEDPEDPQSTFAETVDGEVASGFSLSSPGFLELDRDAAGAWRASLLASDPSAFAPFLPSCDPAAGGPPALCVAGLGP